MFTAPPPPPQDLFFVVAVTMIIIITIKQILFTFMVSLHTLARF